MAPRPGSIPWLTDWLIDSLTSTDRPTVWPTNKLTVWLISEWINQWTDHLFLLFLFLLLLSLRLHVSNRRSKLNLAEKKYANRSTFAQVYISTKQLVLQNFYHHSKVKPYECKVFLCWKPQYNNFIFITCMSHSIIDTAFPGLVSRTNSS